jgi:hypothetical protein
MSSSSMALSEISSQQAAPTENAMKRVNQFLDYMWTHPDAVILYRASDIILNVHIDASFLCTKGMQPGRWLFLPRQFTTQRGPNQTQRSHSRLMHHPQACCCLRCRSQTGCTFPECPRSKSFLTHPCQTGPSTTANTNTH